jgi:hypothetical protein
MTPVFHRIERVLGMLLLAVATSSCMDQGDLFGPDPEAGPPRIRLGAAGYDLHSGEHVDVSVANLGARDGMVELLVLDASREVVWRSTRVVVDDTIVDVPVTSIPAEMVGSSALSLTASLESDGVRVYASDDTAAAVTRDQAALRPVRFYAGDVVAVDAGGVQSLALDAGTGRLYFAATRGARIGTFDLGGNREIVYTDVPGGPVWLRFSHGRLGALTADGTELAVFDAAAATLTPRERVLVPTLRLDVQTLRAAADSAGPAEVDTLHGTVRPYARAFTWGCRAPDCSSVVAFATSDLAGAEAEQGGSVMRRIGVAGARVDPLVAPIYRAGLLATDTIPSRVRVFTAGSQGADSLALDRADRMRCPTVALGGPAFDVSGDSGAVLYLATAGSGCGDGTRLLRVDGAAGVDPAVNPVAHRNLLGEDRIGPVAEVRVAPDGAFVLVRADYRIHLFDADLRLRSTIESAGATAIAWVEGDSPSEFFAVASPLGITIYDTARRVRVASVPVGPVRDKLLALWRSGTDVFAAAGPLDRDGIVIARISLP